MATRPPQTGSSGRPTEAAAGSDRHSNDALAELCDAIEREMDELRSRYELYFLGIERVEPVRDRATLKQKVARLLTTFTRNAGLRFRIQALHARFVSYERLWDRNGKAREDGTYRRDVFKARLRGRGPVRPGKDGKAAAPAEPVAGGALAQAEAAAPGGAPAPGKPAAGPAPKTAAPRPPPGPRADDPQLRALYDAYVSAKKRCNEDVSHLSFDAMARTVAQQTPVLRDKLKAKEIDFKVVIQNGRAVLKAVPRG